ncbi:unnamed protein product [Paramecium octaurelia]|uniref:Uncharacterized protein n=1 Tax=Paramecium octaurelia TaxID=43137 RepID=A0A8S1U4H2_PAROT|nr:unnamed protein product [Paramecium octaurelia]
MSQMESNLRGGGCGTSIRNPLYSEISKFAKAVVAADNSESQEIMIALQWFIFQEENIYNLTKNAQSVAKCQNLILEGIRKLLKGQQIPLNVYISQTTASLSKVIFSFHLLNKESFMKCDLQQEFLEISDELRQQMEIEKNDLIQNQMELYLFLTKTSFEIIPNNSNEREEILQGCLSGIIRSIIDMKPNEKLLESLFQGACHLYNLYAVTKNRKQFEVYFQIDMLYGRLQAFKNEKFQNLDEIILHVQEIHDKIVKYSNVWKYHYLWVQMIGKFLQYNPLLTKEKLSQMTKDQSQIKFGMNI